MTRRLLAALLGAAVTIPLCTLFGACHDGGGDQPVNVVPDNPEGPAIDNHVRGIPDPAPVPERTGPAEETHRRRESGYEVVSYARHYSHNNERYPLLAPNGYVGQIVQVRSLSRIPDPVTVPRGPGSIAILNVTGSQLSSVQLAEVSQHSVIEAINRIIAAQPRSFPARLRISIERVRNREEIQIAIGASASYMGMFSAEMNFQSSSRSDNMAMLVTLELDAFTLQFERPGEPHRVFAPNVSLAEVAPHITPENPAGYVSQMTYGQRFHLLVESTASEESMRATLEANLNLGIFGGGASGGVRYLTDLQGIRISGYAYGGAHEQVMQAMFAGLESWRTFKDQLIASSDLRAMAPTSYAVRSLATDELLKNGVMADYTYEVRSALPPEVPGLVSPANNAMLDNGCAVDRNPVDWTFRWTSVANAVRYAIEVNNRTSGLLVQTEVADTQYRHNSIGALRPDGWTWRVRAFANGIWQPWSDSRTFRLEPVNSDCRTGVEFFRRTDYGGEWIFIEATQAAIEGIDFERMPGGWDDDIDSLRIYNLRGVRLFENPLRAPWNGNGGSFFFTANTRDTRLQGFPINSASAFRIDLGLPW
jgi:hypothetical protein